MRLVVTTIAAALAAGLIGCSDSSPPVTPPAGGPDTGLVPPAAPFLPRGDLTELARLEFGDELSESPVEAAADGPWQVRRTVRHAGSDARGRDRGRAPGTPMPESSSADAEMSEGGEPDSGGIVTLGDRPVVGGLGGGAGGGFRGGDGSGADLGEPAEKLDAPPPVTSPPPTPADEPAADPSSDAPGARDAARRTSRPTAAPAQDLKAGATDDNEEFEKYVEFLDTWVDRKDVRELYQRLDVRDRRFLRVSDRSGAPVPGAVVSVVDEEADRVLFTGTTYGDGRVAYYPHLLAPQVGGDGATPGPILVEAYLPTDGEPVGMRTEWDGTSQEFEVVLDGAPALADPLQLDVCLLIDTTGSMADEIASIKQALLRMTQKLRSLDREFDLRYGAVLYRDIGDQYLTAKHPFTSDVESFDEALRSVGANGGGDGPESLNQGLAQAVDGVDWRPDAAKVVFLIADAQPHMDYAGDVPYGESLQAAVAKGIRVHSVAASGLNAVGTLVFRQIAQMTRGKFIFIEYGSTAATAESHGVAGNVKSNNLEDILFEQIRDELAMYGRE